MFRGLEFGGCSWDCACMIKSRVMSIFASALLGKLVFVPNPGHLHAMEPGI